MFRNEKRRRPAARTEMVRTRSVGLDGLPRAARWRALAGPLALAAATAALTTVLLGAGTKPFPYRLGEVAASDLRLSTRLEIYNDTKTRNAQEEEARKSQLVFLHNPQPNVELAHRLEALATAVARESSLENIDPVLAGEWKLTPESFQSLKQIVPTEKELPAFRENLDRAMEQILQRGVLDPATLPPDLDRETNRIEVHTVGSDQPKLGHLDAVLSTTLSRSDGPFAQRLARIWTKPNQSTTIFQLLAPSLKPTLIFDPQRTKAAEQLAREHAEPVIDVYPEGYLVVPRGEPITEERLLLLREEHSARARSESVAERTRHLIGLAVIVVFVFAAVGMYLRLYRPAQLIELPRLALLCTAWLATAGLSRLLTYTSYPLEIMPIAVTCLLFAIAFDRSFALVMAFALSVLVSLVESRPMEHFVVALGGTAMGIAALDSVRSRTKLINVGLVAGSAYAVLSVALGLFGDQPFSLVVEDTAWRFSCGLLAGFLISGSLPFIESIFGVVTDISLIELADTSHPLLQELIRRAPGTYNHSVSVSIIAETAAQRIGANSLLVRVGALYHDIGKMLKPHYFIENKTADEKNRHDQLAPALSTLIIIGHVKDGMDLARQHHLPQPIVDMIEQHHGTTLVDYFYHEATREQQSAPDPDETVDESSFRYPGPRPRSKEAAVLMLADCVESASRALSEPTPASIEKLVHSLARSRLLDGQFNESGLTLMEVEAIEDSLTKSLTSVYHGRIRYPAAV